MKPPNVGSWLAGKRREDVVLATKVAAHSGMTWIRGGGRLDRDNIRAAIETSLKRLRTDYVDLYQVHWPARDTNYFGQLGYTHHDSAVNDDIEETLEALDGLVRSGKVRSVGVSNETPWGISRYLELARARGFPRIASTQNPYNLLNRAYEVGLAEFAHRESVGLLAYSPLGFGALSGKYLDGARPEGARLSRWSAYFPRYITELAQQTTRKYVDLARESGLDPAQMALAYVNSRPFVASNIIGATSLEQLAANIASANLTLTDDVLEAIENIHMQQPNPCP